MIVLTETDNTEMWICWKYGVAMLAAHAAAFCARRFAAANRKDAAGIMFNRCRWCTRGAAEYKLAKRKGIDMLGNRESKSSG